jgi:hypothetical protein
MFGLFKKPDPDTTRTTMSLERSAILEYIRRESNDRAATVPQQKGIHADSYFTHNEARTK